MLWINLVAVGGLVWGFVGTWRVIGKGRRAYPLEDSLVTWDESPAPAMDYDKLGAALIAFHAAAVVVLCVLLVFSVNRAGDGPFSLAYRSPLNRWLVGIVGFEDKQINNLSLFIAALSAGIAAMTCGAIVAFPFSRWFIRPVRTHLGAQGVIYGQNSAAWEQVRFYEVDRSRGLFKLFTQKQPNTPTFVLRPGEALLAQVEKTLADMLPGRESKGDAAASRGRRQPALLFVVVTLLALVAGMWLYWYAAEWAWFLSAAVIVGCSALGMLIPKI